MSTLDPTIGWRPETRRLDQLTPLENNPFGRITQEKRRRLEAKLLELGVFEAATLDTQGVLLTFNKRHNLLLGLYGPSYVVNVLVPDRELPEGVRKKIILASNVSEGEWIDEILREQYHDVLADVGLSLAAMDELVAEAGAAGPDVKPEYPIVAEFSEKYDAVVIVCRNDIDANYVREVLGLSKEQSYKSQEVPMLSSFSSLPALAEVLAQQGVQVKPLREGVSHYLDVIDELLAETDPMGEAYQLLELSDRREQVATFYALLLA